MTILISYRRTVNGRWEKSQGVKPLVPDHKAGTPHHTITTRTELEISIIRQRSGHQNNE